MVLVYTGEKVVSPDGDIFEVLDTAKLDFTKAAQGYKASQTLVREARDGEKIHTRNDKGQIESTHVTKAGEAIFINLHNPDDIYVPGNSDGSRWQFSELAERGFEIVGEDKDNGGVRVISAKTFPIMHEVIEKPTCLKDCWGEGQHGYFYPGATLKDNGNGRVTGIDKSAFDATWKVGSPSGS